MNFYRFQLGALFFASVVIVFLGCRPYDLGHDMDAYQELFDSALNGDHFVEPLFGLFSLAAGTVGAGFRGVLWIYAIVSIGVKLVFLRLGAGLAWKFIFGFLIIYVSTFMWLYDVSQLRASVMLTLIPFLFLSRKGSTYSIVGFAGIFSHYSGAVAAVQRLIRMRGLWRIISIPVAISFVAINSGQLSQYAVELVLDKYAGTVDNPTMYFAHPYFLSQALFLWRNRASKDNEYGVIAMASVWWTVLALCSLFVMLLLLGSRTAAFRFLEMGLYLSFLFSYVMYAKNRSDKFSAGVCLFLASSFMLFNFILAEIPIVNIDILNNFLNPL